MSGEEVRRRMISFQEVDRVGFLIKGHLQQYMDKNETVENVMIEADVQRNFTEAVWERLEEENKEFFRAYYDRLVLKKQIMVFNWLLAAQVNTVMCQSRVASVSPPSGHPTCHTSAYLSPNNVRCNTIPATAIINHCPSGNPSICVGNNGLVRAPMMENWTNGTEIHSQSINSSSCTPESSGQALNAPVTDVEMPLLEPINQAQPCFSFSDRTIIDMFERSGMLPILPSEINNFSLSPTMELNAIEEEIGQEDFRCG